MDSIVIDTNVALSWCVRQRPEAAEYARKALTAIVVHDLTVVVPPHWHTELGAVLLRYHRNPQNDFSLVELQTAIGEIGDLDIQVHEFIDNFADIVQAGIDYNLTGYDAPFFHIAKVLGCPIATQDKAIIGACQRFGVKWFNPG